MVDVNLPIRFRNKENFQFFPCNIEKSQNVEKKRWILKGKFGWNENIRMLLTVELIL